ncbi:MAG: glutathione S-transferase family protein [Burkholderiales bacterium]|nr:glutathione S-transferase family protein [Burkholderiales bacterium]
MGIEFYYGSGSPFAWNVWLVLEHKRLPYEFNLLSFRNGELKTKEYLAINPRGKVPALVDGDFALWEASAIVEYLDERYPNHPVFPSDPIDRATVRRLSAEAYNYLYPPLRRLMDLQGSGGETDLSAVLKDVSRELDYFEDALHGNRFAGSAADFTLYPLLALAKRLGERRTQPGAGAHIRPKLDGFMQRIEALPYFPKTIPPHWKG